MNGEMVRILAGNMFLVSDDRGDLDAVLTQQHGLFSFDTRFLSTWQLTVNGERLRSLSVDKLQYFATRFFLIPGAPTHYINAKLSVIREQSVTGVFEEQLTFLNHDPEPVDLRIHLEVATDFADLFELKGVERKVGNYYTRMAEKSLCLGYQRERFRRETVISTTAPVEIDERGLTFVVRIESHHQWTVGLHVTTAVLSAEGREVRAGLDRQRLRSKKEMERDLAGWLERAPRLECDWEPLTTTYRQSLVDLAALRFSTLTLPQESLPAAGLPWFMTIIGRDSIFTSLQALPFVPEFAATTVRILGNGQGSKLDDFRDEEPGKILREFRYGETAAFEEKPHSPYYGSADATPLYVTLLDEYERWTGDDGLVREYEQEARAALDWIDGYGDLLGNGYIWYQPRNEQTGVPNQCWKESWDSISYRDGRLPELPRATCELQGYAYDAKIRGARLARQFWHDPAYADRLEREAADLKQRFNRDYWVEDGEYYALALDPDGNQVDALSSNIGHLLWSGIVEESRARSVAGHLVGPQLFSGWGVRTLAKGEGRYNPFGYHVGAVWPFDNSFIAWGLWRYGLRDEAGRIAEGMIDAAQFFEGRLPEAFGGYDRELTKYPVQYPTACSPQAWSSGAPLLLLRAMLGLQPHGDHLVVKPALPTKIGQVELLGIPGRWGRMDAFGRGRLEAQAHEPSYASQGERL